MNVRKNVKKMFENIAAKNAKKIWRAGHVKRFVRRNVHRIAGKYVRKGRQKICNRRYKSEKNTKKNAKRMSEEMSEDMSKEMSEDMSIEMSDNMSEKECQ